MNSLLQESLTDVCDLLTKSHIRFALVSGIGHHCVVACVRQKMLISSY